MSDLYEMQFIGRLGTDPEARYTPEGRLVANFRVAVNRRWKNAAGEVQEATEWVEVAAWGPLGELCHQYLTKGRRVWVRGRPEARAWIGKDGEAHAALRVTAREVQFLDSPRNGGNGEAAPADDLPAPEEDLPF